MIMMETSGGLPVAGAIAENFRAINPMDQGDRKTWSDNTALLYEFFNAQSCEWPSLSVEWVRNVAGASKDGV